MLRDMTNAQRILDELDPALYLSGDDVSERYDCDWSAVNALRPAVVLRPRTTTDVATMLALCHRAGQPLVIQGGMTGLSGGATPQTGEWALSLERLNGIVDLDPDGMTITVGAGTPLATVQDRAADIGLRFPLDLGARGSCLAGGIVATNAGGNEVIQHGMTRALVLGLDVVLADGTVVPARNRLLKNNTGFDLKQLFIGSEGALGVITEVTFRLVPDKPYRQTALIALPSFAAAATLLRTLPQALDAIASFELLWADYYRAALAATGAADPLGGEHPFYLLLEAEGVSEKGLADALEQALAGAFDAGLVADAAIAKSSVEAKALWAIRDGIGEILTAWPHIVVYDIGIPVNRMEAFVDKTRAALATAYADCRLLVFGHMGDGNLHLAVTTGRAEDKTSFDGIVYGVTRSVAGVVSGEHGLGVLKKDWLDVTRSAPEIALMRQLKATLDPTGILNRGRVVDVT